MNAANNHPEENGETPKELQSPRRKKTRQSSS